MPRVGEQYGGSHCCHSYSIPPPPHYTFPLPLLPSTGPPELTFSVLCWTSADAGRLKQAFPLAPLSCSTCSLAHSHLCELAPPFLLQLGLLCLLNNILFEMIVIDMKVQDVNSYNRAVFPNLEVATPVLVRTTVFPLMGSGNKAVLMLMMAVSVVTAMTTLSALYSCHHCCFTKGFSDLTMLPMLPLLFHLPELLFEYCNHLWLATWEVFDSYRQDNKTQHSHTHTLPTR